MKKLKTIYIISIIWLLVIFAGCSTINNLDEYNIRGMDIAMDMRIPPKPTVEVNFTPVDFGGDGLLAVVQLGSNILKSEGAAKAEKKLQRALDGLYIPEYAAELTFDRIVKTLNGRMVSDYDQADIILEIEIEEYGIEAYSYGGDVSMVFAMTASFYHPADNEIIWKRNINVEREITPGFFSFDDIIGNVITIASLNNLDEEELSEGFQAITYDIMQETIELLHDDLRKARN